MHFRWQAGAVLALFALCVGGSAFAESSGDESTVEEIVVVGYGARTAVTGTKIETSLLEIPQSIATVSETLIDERQPTSLSEALFNISGVVDSGSRRAFDNLIIRGFPASFSIYQDGLRVERGNYNVPQEPYGLERIEVLKGPGSVLYGQGSLGGIINQVSRSAAHRSRPEVEFGFGSFGTAQVRADVSGALRDDVSVRLVGLYRDLQESVDFNGRERTYISPSVSWSNDSTRFTVLGNYTGDRNKGAYVGLPAEGTVLPNPNGPLDRSLYIGEPGDDEVTVDRYQIGYQFVHDFGGGWVSRQYLRFTDSDVFASATFSGGFRPDFRNLNRASGAFASTDQSTALDTHLQYSIAGRNVENTTLVGADLLFQSVESTFDFSFFPALDLYAPVYGGPKGPAFPVLRVSDDVTLYGLYVQNQLKLGDRWTFLAGVRFDASEIDNTNRLSSASRTQDDEDVTFRLGGAYQVSDGIALYVSYAEAFNPNFGINAFGEPFKAETGTQYEAGIKTDLADGRVRTTASLYQLTRDNVLVPFPEFPGTRVQTGQQRSQGLELDAAFDITANWRLTAAYAYTDVKVRKDTNEALLGDTPISVPEHQANLWTSYDIALDGGALTFGTGARYVGQREGTLPNTYTLSSYVVFDAEVAYRKENWHIQANIYNLFDEDHILSASPTGPRSVMPGEPFTARLLVGYRF